MARTAMKKPTPRKVRNPKSQTFQSRVDYAAKALKRGSWGARFDECFCQHDSHFVVAAIMLRARKNEELKSAIMSSFGVSKWSEVPWQETAKPYVGMTARQIVASAEIAREESQQRFKEIYKDPSLMMSIR